jgi:WD40 repeat protein
MESLFTNEKKKSQRLLAILETEDNPINCVRWNSIGTLIATADDVGKVCLWEYKGETFATEF